MVNGIPSTARRLVISVLFASSVLFTGASVAQDAESHSRMAGGLTVDYGIIPAEIVKGHPAKHPEAAMHGGAPTTGNEYHLVVAIFDTESGARVTDAKVTAAVFGPGNVALYGQRHMSARGARPLIAVPQKPIEPMTIGQTITYGGYFVLPKPAKYTFQFTIIRRPGSRPVVVTFQHDLQSG